MTKDETIQKVLDAFKILLADYPPAIYAGAKTLLETVWENAIEEMKK